MRGTETSERIHQVPSTLASPSLFRPPKYTNVHIPKDSDHAKGKTPAKIPKVVNNLNRSSIAQLDRQKTNKL